MAAVLCFAVLFLGIMYQYEYKSILENVMEPYSFKSMPINYIFQHDNGPKHSSRLVKGWLSGQNIDGLYLKVIISNQLKVYGQLLIPIIELFQLVPQSWQIV